MEAAAPLVVIAIVSAGTGLVAAAIFLRSQLGASLRPPGVDYYVIVLAGIVASLGVITSTLALIVRITGPEVPRNEWAVNRVLDQSLNRISKMLLPR